ncbi:flagellar basal body P-ring formation chaperone FlgA [Alsobacter sp. SYSU M60028]|uniref:Flagellar basal body P-ring formation chaperone FlgA n=1 Tax=Alsobacter ponti TaxID=2962936 RepID=A0ABT1L8P0_9HYPH|nr:flagellar basal body P-ring formation chaperone FlgA [Alsobacter ponti]MCP8937326.1 flagellar basal body P-ring formation chaperone FlgA [Alsobacter ponti]
MTVATFALRAALGLAAALAPALALAQGAPAVRPNVLVQGETVLLGDLVDNAGAAALSPVFRAPAPGRSGTIQIVRVIEAASAAGVGGLDKSVLSQVVVTRAARRVEKDEIAAALAAALARQGLDQAEIAVTLENDDPALFVETDATGPVGVPRLAYDPRAQRVEAEVTVGGSRLLTLRPARVSASVVDSVPTPVLGRALSRGDVLREGDIRLERRPRREALAGVADAASLVGKVAKVQLSAGAILRDADLARQTVVDKGGAVQVVFETVGLNLSARGKALESGAVGDIVAVQNIQSKRTLQGTVIGPGIVSVMAAPGRVAAAEAAVR